MADNVIKSFSFALQIIKLFPFLKDDKKETKTHCKMNSQFTIYNSQF